MDEFSRSTLRAAAVCLLLAFLLPALLIRPEGREDAAFPYAHESGVSSDGDADTSVRETETAPEERSASDLRVLVDGEVREMPMEEYLWGVVAAEMPAAFEQEALRAQAVAARTYTLYQMDHPSLSHPEADICTDPGCCQAWMSREERMGEWERKNAKKYAKKITNAVESTAGQVLTYAGEPIYAAFHASSAGYTKSAAEVWGEDYPYLQGVESPEETKVIPNYYSTVRVPAAQFRESVLAAMPKAQLEEDDLAGWIGDTRYDAQGLPEEVCIGGQWVKTGVVRGWFELRSASFTVQAEAGGVTFYVTGYGHGVGMSQYGANALAKQGKNAEEILKWYYRDVEISTE